MKQLLSCLFFQQHAIVNTTGESINLQDNPVARALAQGAGPQLQQECSTKAPIAEGQVKVTSGYKLECNVVIHCRIAGHYDGSQNSQQVGLLRLSLVSLV